MLRIRAGFLASLAAGTLVTAPLIAHAQEFYKGKTVTIIVGFSPGGGYDAYARVLAKYLPEHIPGHPTVVVQNMPGAGSLVAVRSLNTTQPKDGTVMVTFNNGLINRSKVQPKRVNVDFTKLAWVGVVTPDFRVCYGYGPKGIKSWNELLHGGKKYILGSTAKGSGDYINGAELRVIFGVPVKQVLGFPGSAQVRLAIEQGELSGDCGSYSSIPQDWLNRHLVHAFVRFNKERSPEIPKSAKYINTFAKTQAQKQLLDFMDAGNELGRPYVMSSAVPADRIAIMRKAFDATMKDPAYLAQMKKEQLPVHPVPGPQAEKIVPTILKAAPAIVAKAKKMYE